VTSSRFLRRRRRRHFQSTGRRKPPPQLRVPNLVVCLHVCLKILVRAHIARHDVPVHVIIIYTHSHTIIISHRSFPVSRGYGCKRRLVFRFPPRPHNTSRCTSIVPRLTCLPVHGRIAVRLYRGDPYNNMS